MPFKLRVQYRRDGSEGLGLFAGDKRWTSSFQYFVGVVLGIVIALFGLMLMLVPFAGDRAARSAAHPAVFIWVGLVTVMLGVFKAHAGVIFFVMRRRTKSDRTSRRGL
jgi:hypothetical protein